MLISTAQNYARRKGVEVTEALRRVISTIDIFACAPDGRVDIEHDTYLQQILDRNSLSRMVGKQADMSVLSFDEIALLAQGNGAYSRMNKAVAAPKGKTGLSSSKVQARKQMNREDLKLVDKARKTLTTIVEHLPYLAYATKTTTVRASLEACDAVDDYREYVTAEFGVTPRNIIELFDRGVLNYDLASLQKTAKIMQIERNVA
jgi:hypothetical protein